MNRNNLRKAINTLHLWMGLASGLIIFVVCLSGTTYTFRSEIERWAEPGKYYAIIPQGKSMLLADSLVAITENRFIASATAISVPGNPEMNWQITVKKKSGEKRSAANTKESSAPPEKPKTYFINPYTGEIVGEQGGSTSEFFTKVMQLHRWLLMDDSIGRIIVGTATLIFVFMILSGLVLWFPARIKNLRQGLKIKTSGSWKRTNHDLHNTLGFYSFLILLVMSLTGLCWSFEWYRDGLSDVLGAKVFKGRGEKPMQSSEFNNSGNFAKKDLFISVANQQFSYVGNLRVTLPEDSTSAITATKSATGFFAVAGADKVQIDRFTGKVLKTESFSDKKFNAKIADSIKILHTGEIFGTISKIIYFIVCLIATSLPVTGTMIWLNKNKKNKIPQKVNVKKAEQLT